ncbi:MAG: HEAT repeat domain-containing protein, partial [Gemmataceae bacterium]
LLTRALKDPVSSRRGAAATALLKVPGGDHLAEVRKLLFDPDAEVRVAVALDLVQKGDKEAIPALIDGLDQPSSARFGRIEDILIRLAREQSPILTGEDLPARREYQKAWRTWWKDHGAKIDMALLDAKPKMLGRTLIVLLDANQVVDLDETNKVRRKIDDIEMALDMESLPGDRVLLAEYRANRVSERDAEGKVIWERSVPEPLTAQRLLNGNTFIASKDYLLEVDRKGKQVFRYNPPAATQIMRARKLPSGEILMVSQLGASQLTRLSRFGKELKSFPVDVSTSGGRLEVTPAGNILVPEMYSNRIVEYDPDGRVVRAIPAQQPIACTLLPSGNLLVTSMTEKRAVELDRAGKEVWEYRRDTRVTRAVRY